jgi:hypothetical protein
MSLPALDSSSNPIQWPFENSVGPEYRTIPFRPVDDIITSSPSSRSALGCEMDNLDPGLEVTEVVLVLLEPVDSLVIKNLFLSQDDVPI